MPKDLMFILPYRAGVLAQLATTLGKAGISIAGCAGKEFGPEEIVHLLVEDAAGAASETSSWRRSRTGQARSGSCSGRSPTPA
jgi:hypothetical protein